MDSLSPSSHAEAVALFRHGILGALTQAQLERGQLRAALAGLATQRFRPPMSKTTRSYSVPTLEPPILEGSVELAPLMASRMTVQLRPRSRLRAHPSGRIPRRRAPERGGDGRAIAPTLRMSPTPGQLQFVRRGTGPFAPLDEGSLRQLTLHLRRHEADDRDDLRSIDIHAYDPAAGPTPSVNESTTHPRSQLEAAALRQGGTAGTR